MLLKGSNKVWEGILHESELERTFSGTFVKALAYFDQPGMVVVRLRNVNYIILGCAATSARNLRGKLKRKEAERARDRKSVV